MKQYDKQFKEEAVKTERRQKLLVKIYEIPDEPPDSDNYGANRMYLALRNKEDYTAERPNQKWRSDSTQIPCSDGKLCIAPGHGLLQRRDYKPCNGRQHEGGFPPSVYNGKVTAAKSVA